MCPDNKPVKVHTIVVSTQHDEFMLPENNSTEAQAKTDQAMCDKINKEEGRGTIEVLNESFEFKQIKNEPGSEKFQEIFKELNRMECKDLGVEFIPFTKKDIKENIIFSYFF